MQPAKIVVRKSKSIDPSAVEAAKTSAETGSPGPLRSIDPSRVWVHTSQALRLVKGRRHTEDAHGIIGLIHFGQRVQFLCDAVKADDPYADWWLIQISEKIADVKSELASHREQIEKLMLSRDGIDVSVGRSSTPISTPLLYRDASPYVFAGSELITEFDWLVRAAEQCKRTALMLLADAYRLIDACGHRIRSVFTFTAKWRNQSITREDVRQATQVAQRAKQAMPGLPQDVLDETRRDPFAPVVGTKRRTVPLKSGSVLPPSNMPVNFFASNKLAGAKTDTEGPCEQHVSDGVNAPVTTEIDRK